MGSPTFDTSRARFGDLIAAASGLLLFISLFLHWYSISVKTALASIGGVSASGWQALSFIDILLFIISVIAVAVAVARMAGAMPARLPVSPGFILLVAGGIAVLLVLFRIISIPDDGAGDLPGVDVGRSFGIFIALIAAAGVTVGGWLNWNEEGKPMPGQAGAGRGPLGAGQPGPFGAGPGGGAQQGYGQPPQQQGFAQPPQQQGFAQPPQQQAQPAQQQQPAAAQQQTGGQAKADWYPDPRGEKRLRYYDGTQWTDHTAD